MNIGTKNGETRSGPFSRKRPQFSSKVCIPPMPLPMTTPIRSWLTAAVSSPDWVTAWWAEAIAYCANRSNRRASLRSMYGRGSNPFTSQANRTWCREASNFVMGAAPLVPARRFVQVSSTVSPNGVTSPRPVMTTRRLTSRAQLVVEVLQGVPDRAELLRLLVRDVDVELLLERHDELDGVERVRAEILHEGRLGGELLALDAQFLDDDVLDLLLDVAHLLPRVARWNCVPRSAGHAAIDHEHLARDVGTEIRGEVEYRACDVRRTAEPPERDGLQ